MPGLPARCASAAEGAETATAATAAAALAVPAAVLLQQRLHHDLRGLVGHEAEHELEQVSERLDVRGGRADVLGQDAGEGAQGDV